LIFFANGTMIEANKPDPSMPSVADRFTLKTGSQLETSGMSSMS